MNAFKSALKEATNLCKANNTKVGKQRRQPAITADVQRICSSMPEGYADLYLESSLYNVALETGARAMTVAAGMSLLYVLFILLYLNFALFIFSFSLVNLCHIVTFVQSEDPQMYLLQLLYVTTKGNHNWNHRVTIEGSLTDPGSTIYYLNQHLIRAHSFDLHEYSHWKLSDDQRKTPLWSLSKETMR
jgi:hypothetical protein